jgi:GNAT superfamily N-acetyltransferase
MGECHYLLFAIFPSLTIILAPRATFKRHAVNTDDHREPKRVKKASSTTTTTRKPSSKKPPYTNSQTKSLLTRVNDLRLDQFASQHRVPSSLAHFTAKNGHEYKVQLSSSDCMEATQLEQLCDLVEETSAEDYENSSRGWDYFDKKEEMRNSYMKFLLPFEEEVGEEEGDHGADEGTVPSWFGQSLVGFCSFMLCREKRLPVIYVYEIHFFDREGCRGNGVGKKLIQLVESIGRRAGVVKSMLTVFTANVRAERFYRSLGYSEDQTSPVAKVLKSGKVRKPEYFILSKSLLQHNREENGTEKGKDEDADANQATREIAQMDGSKGKEEEDVALPIYDATGFLRSSVDRRDPKT